MKNPLVSVLMTVYNDEAYIGKAIDSVLHQTFPDFELVVVNDGSTDRTSDILYEYKHKDPRIRIFNQENQGTANAANAGMSYCRGKYIARLDSDDISYPHRLAVELEFLERNPAVGLVGGGCDIMDQSGRVIGQRNILTTDPRKTLIKRCIYQQSDVMFRKSVLDKLYGKTVYRSKFRGAEDYDLWLRISEVASVAKINRIMGAWRLNGGGYTLARKQEQIEAIRELKRMAVSRRKGKADWYERFEPVLKEVSHRTHLKTCEYDKTVAQVLLKSGRTREARMQLKKYQHMEGEWHAVKRWYYLAFLPKGVLRFLFSCREFMLNNMSIELR